MGHPGHGVSAYVGVDREALQEHEDRCDEVAAVELFVERIGIDRADDNAGAPIAVYRYEAVVPRLVDELAVEALQNALSKVAQEVVRKGLAMEGGDIG